MAEGLDALPNDLEAPLSHWPMFTDLPPRLPLHRAGASFLLSAMGKSSASPSRSFGSGCNHCVMKVSATGDIMTHP
jgi:hypothetical protein